MLIKENDTIKKIKQKDSYLPEYSAKKTVKFFHKATANQEIIDLTSLVFPALEMPTLTQASPSEIDAMKLFANDKFLVLTSTLKGNLILGANVYQGFTVLDNYKIKLNTPATLDEIFIGTMVVTSYETVTTDARRIVRTYNLAQGATSLSLGEDFKITNLTSQIGDLIVCRNGTQVLRNVGNVTASVSADGNYQEVDSGNGYGSLITFNEAPTDVNGDVVTVDFGKQSTGDQAMWGKLEQVQSSILKMAQDLAEIAGDYTDISRYFSGNASEVDRRTFGDLVLSNKANVDLLLGAVAKPSMIRVYTSTGLVAAAGPSTRTIPWNGVKRVDTTGVLTLDTINNRIYCSKEGLLLVKTVLNPSNSAGTGTANSQIGVYTNDAVPAAYYSDLLAYFLENGSSFPGKDISMDGFSLVPIKAGYFITTTFSIGGAISSLALPADVTGNFTYLSVAFLGGFV